MSMCLGVTTDVPEFSIKAPHLMLCRGPASHSCSFHLHLPTPSFLRPADNKQNAEEDETSTPPKLIHTFLCDDCDYTTRNENFLIRHRRAHVETNSLLQCHVCDEEFPQLALLEAHTPSHLTARPYMCDVCGARFQNLTNVKDHVRKHTRERPFACKVCGRTFVYRSSWISHAKTHPEQRPFACHLCPETFLLKRSLKDHYMKQHTNKQCL
ncbi:zinc finger protein 135 [Ixodes scapularis]|uniref:zinc finger protein 135 n=1 Tax=Ixodes scapularis TaxID=6945 RepID=UPI001A9F99A3|nr:zinc finger protein 135 [Ixodes scapularis]